ncbi:outer membrane protein assembly factor BamD [Coxiella endosymbiont of Amblyomma americanum]|uniref:outer membrane protein assembly factor BamD n=1 Tax=Coxiella endosymbiont of Amblyomma americanum TaxID=325775 RepID=UPI0005823963|nr:outer membrane protein assembly factor BamD [Coxiella endosymbiont of Amblyomma americanum]AJC50347.1 Beta-barrel assembly machine subunit BamD [Coxiella endosymbiont of Amblyomma americanum]AUJ58694.1 outer membrane protein assembly factor BamD [Coxiella-like endosymbiont of Amblyomma americanum]
MKKLLIITIFLCLCVLNGCTAEDFDPYQGYRKRSEIALFAAGKRALEKRNYSEAIKNFEALNVIYPSSSHILRKARLNVICAYYKNKDISSTISAANRYIRFYPKDCHVDLAYYIRGISEYHKVTLSRIQNLMGVNVVTRDISILQQSYETFSVLVDAFPKSAYTADALTCMKHIRSLMAQHEIIIAQFYLKRHAYVAAANRAACVVQNFQDSPENVAKGLKIIDTAYHALGLINFNCQCHKTYTHSKLKTIYHTQSLSYEEMPKFKRNCSN